MQAVSVRRITPVMICLAKGCDSLCVCGKEAAGGAAGGVQGDCDCVSRVSIRGRLNLRLDIDNDIDIELSSLITIAVTQCGSDWGIVIEGQVYL